MTQQTDNNKPPTMIRIRYCDKCGRTDEVMALKPRHFAAGELCLGAIKVAIYRRDDDEDEGQ